MATTDAAMFHDRHKQYHNFFDQLLRRPSVVAGYDMVGLTSTKVLGVSEEVGSSRDPWRLHQGGRDRQHLCYSSRLQMVYHCLVFWHFFCFSKAAYCVELLFSFGRVGEYNGKAAVDCSSEESADAVYLKMSQVLLRHFLHHTHHFGDSIRDYVEF